MKSMKYFFVVGIMGVLFMSCTNDNQKFIYEKNNIGFYEISQKQAKHMIDNEEVYIIDVREEDEYEEGHIEDSILIPLNDVSSEIENIIPNKEAKILVYCRTGKRSKVASGVMADLGYKNVYDFGGIFDWQYGIVH